MEYWGATIFHASRYRAPEEYLPDSLLLLLLWKDTHLLSLLILGDEENMIEIDSLLSFPAMHTYIRIGEIITWVAESSSAVMEDDDEAS